MLSNPKEVPVPAETTYAPGLLDSWYYEKLKKGCKDREVLWTCFAAVFDLGGDLGYRPDLDRIRKETDTAEGSKDGKVFGRICSLATIIHDVGDLFSIEMVMPAPFWDHPALAKLLNLPGVYT